MEKTPNAPASRSLHTSHPQVRALIRILKDKGIREIVISSGSRNAPLIRELTIDPYFRCFSAVDERSAAFFALGLSKESGRPAATLCTSGSAVLNYYPAVAEAYYSRVPLIVLSADRPAQWIDQAVGQTIRQDGVLSSHTVYNATLREGNDAQTAWYNAREINRAINAALRHSAPAHLNIPLSEPLYDTAEPAQIVADPYPRPIEDLPLVHSLAPEAIDRIRRLWERAERKMVLVGARHADDRLGVLLERLMRESDTIVLCETTSNLGSGPFIRHIDRMILPLSQKQAASLHPDLLVTCGGMVVSKKVKTFLQQAAPSVHIHVGLHAHPDTYMSLTHCARTDDTVFFGELVGAPCRNTGYVESWIRSVAGREKAHRAYCSRAPYSDFAVWEALSRALPPDSHLEIANSASVRYSQLFPLPEGVTVGCNRGTSGIDGSTSTAVGAAVALAPRPVTLVSGDLAFLYDNNALWNDHMPASMRLIVLNNGGGGIFRILDGARTSPFASQYLQAVHGLELEPLARMHGLDYRRVSGMEELHEALSVLWRPSRSARLLEIDTRRCDNDRVLREYFASLGGH